MSNWLVSVFQVLGFQEVVLRVIEFSRKCSLLQVLGFSGALRVLEFGRTYDPGLGFQSTPSNWIWSYIWYELLNLLVSVFQVLGFQGVLRVIEFSRKCNPGFGFFRSTPSS